MTDPRTTLPAIARAAIAEKLGIATVGQHELPGELMRPGASFVTLKKDGELRGCIGTLSAWRPLAEDVQQNALAAAFRDPRFSPLQADEWPDITLEVSLLSPPQPFPVADEADTCRQLRPGVDGLTLKAGARCATFLPQVWEQLPEPHEFLAQLKRKAGLPGDYWGPDISLERYTVTPWHEKTSP